MKLTQIAVLLAGAALSASVLAATDTQYKIENDVFFGNPMPSHTNTMNAKAPVRFGDENDTSWLTPHSKPAFAGKAAVDRAGLPNDLDEQAIAQGTATHGVSVFASKKGNASAE